MPVGMLERNPTLKAEMDAIEKQLKALETKRERIAARHGKARAAAELKLEQARDDYDSQLAEWEA